VLESQGENSHSARRFCFTSVARVVASGASLTRLVRAAIAIEQAGLAAPRRAGPGARARVPTRRGCPAEGRLRGAHAGSSARVQLACCWRQAVGDPRELGRGLGPEHPRGQGDARPIVGPRPANQGRVARDPAGVHPSWVRADASWLLSRTVRPG
jgi:hypothetical protein